MQFKRSLLSVALASALQTIALGAQAADETGAQLAAANEAAVTQEQSAEAKQAEADKAAAAKAAEEEQAIETLTVTGIRAGIERAIDAKRNADTLVEAISAEDIGKLPDASIAESIARLPGLTAQRVAGRSSTIQIRGLAEDFGTTLLNGREQVSTGNNRGVEFDQYPAELMSGVVVHKTQDAAMIGQGLSGTVDLQTVRPLAFDDRVMTANARIEKNSNGELNPGYDDMGNRLSFSYIDQFLDHTLGIAVGYAHLDTPSQANRWEAWGYLDYVDVDGVAGNDLLLGGSKSQAASVENIRDGYMAVIEYRPNETYSTGLDLYYSEFETEETLRFMETGLGWSGATGSNPVVEGGVVRSATYTGVRPVLRNDLNTKDDNIFAAGWKNEFHLGEQVTGLIDLSYSKAEQDQMILETYSGLGSSRNAAATDTVNYFQGNDHPSFSYGRDYTDPQAIVLTDPGGWGQDGFIKYPKVEDELKSLRMSAKNVFDDGMFSSLEAGVNYADREKMRASGLEAQLRLKGGSEVAVPSELIESSVDLGFTGIPGILSYNAGNALGLYDFDPLVHPDVANKNWTVNEELTTMYAQLNLDTSLGSLPLHGNIGLQSVHAKQSSDGLSVGFSEADAATPFSGGATYTDYLPSLNLILDLSEDQILRFGVGRQVARPRMDELRANNNYSVDVQKLEWHGEGGNPELKPWEANAADLSYEYYFGDSGYVSVAAFYKDLRTYIYKQTVAYDFSGFDTGDLLPANIPISDIGTFTRPENGEGGSLSGFETSVSLPFSLMADALDGFGLQASYSHFNSSISPQGPDNPDEPLPGLSDNVSNITLYYEAYGFSARISQRHRSPFLGEVQGFGGDRSKRFVDEESVVDAQLGYAFGEGSGLDGLSLLIQAYNLTDEPYREYDADKGDLPRVHNEYGRTLIAGVNYRF